MRERYGDQERAIGIGALNSSPALAEALQGGGGRMTVGILNANGDEGNTRIESIKKSPTCGGLTSVMWRLQHIYGTFYVAQNPSIDVALDVTSEERTKAWNI